MRGGQRCVWQSLHRWTFSLFSRVPSQKGAKFGSLRSGTGIWSRSNTLSSQDGEASVAKLSPAGHGDEPGVFDLSRATLATQLAHGLDDVIEAGLVRLRQHPAMGVDRQFP